MSFAAKTDVPTTFFDTLTVHSTCRRCKTIMRVTSMEQCSTMVHPTCEPKPTPLERLGIGWLSAIEAGDEEAAALTQQEIDAEESKPPRLSVACQTYGRWGWPVFPLGRRSKEPAIPKRAGGHGFKDATCDHDRIEAWWSGSGFNRNIGLATGHFFDVIDVDPKNDGVTSFIGLLERGTLPDVHGIAVTASGGMHLYVKPRGTGNFAKLRPGIDYRGVGGYVVAPPSWMGRRERRYTWMTVPSPMIKGEI